MLGRDGTVRVATATGSVEGTVEVGGLIGEARPEATVENVSSGGAVEASIEVSGLIGNVEAGGVIADAFTVGSINDSTGVGGMIGSANQSVTVRAAYWDTEITGQSNSAGNAVGLTTAQMTGEAARTNMSDFAYETIWRTVSGDYPRLQAVEGGPTVGEDSDSGDNGSPLSGAPGEFDANGDGSISQRELSNAAFSFATGELSQAELSEVAFAFATG